MSVVPAGAVAAPRAWTPLVVASVVLAALVVGSRVSFVAGSRLA